MSADFVIFAYSCLILDRAEGIRDWRTNRSERSPRFVALERCFEPARTLVCFGHQLETTKTISEVTISSSLFLFFLFSPFSNFSSFLSLLIIQKKPSPALRHISEAQAGALSKHMDLLKANGMNGYIREYTTIMEGRDATALASKLPPHKRLNRYNNIVAYDHTRVKIKPNPNTHNTDYINANYVDAFNRPNGYIASQGPVPATQPGFWQMVWENKVECIVMVTNEVEGGKMKCHRYWPDSPEEVAQGGQNPKQYGGFTVTAVSEDVLPNYITRSFELKDNRSGQVRKITHYLYTAWPDHGVPDTATEMLSFRHRVKATYNPEHPMLVHCSAGVGRTGTFVGLDRFLDSCAELNSDLSVLEIVRDMRSSRNFMVQAQAQFVYLYEACLEGLRKLTEKCAREITLRSKDSEAKQNHLLGEIERELGNTNTVFLRNMRANNNGQLFDKGDVSVPGHQAFGSRAHDIHTTQKVPGSTRKESLAHSTTQWVKRGNVPLTLEEKGYTSDRSAPLTARLMALSDARTSWLTRYAEAERTWGAEHDLEGVMYDIGAALTPVESRVSSLAASEEAWKLRSGASYSVEDERIRQKLHDLTVRLESLQHGVLNSDRRWRSKGDGFSANNDEPDDETGVHTTGAFGDLGERLSLLSTNQSAYLDRDAYDPYDVQKFHDGIISVAEEQEALNRKRQAELDAAEKSRKKTETELANARAVAKAKADALAAAKRQRESVKAKAVASSKFHGTEDHPTIVAKKKAAAQAKEDASLAKQMAELKTAEDKKAKADAVVAKKAKAKSKAAKFMGKMK